MADNRPGHAKADDKPKTLEEVNAEQKAAQDNPVNQEPLNAESTEPQTATNPTAQEGANQSVLQARGTVWGDNTSSNGAQNQDGLHGRDGGVTAGGDHSGPNNPVAETSVIEGERADDNDKGGEEGVVENAEATNKEASAPTTRRL